MVPGRVGGCRRGSGAHRSRNASGGRRAVPEAPHRVPPRSPLDPAGPACTRSIQRARFAGLLPRTAKTPVDHPPAADDSQHRDGGDAQVPKEACRIEPARRMDGRPTGDLLEARAPMVREDVQEPDVEDPDRDQRAAEPARDEAGDPPDPAPVRNRHRTASVARSAAAAWIACRRGRGGGGGTAEERGAQPKGPHSVPARVPGAVGPGPPRSPPIRPGSTGLPVERRRSLRRASVSEGDRAQPERVLRKPASSAPR